VTTSPPFGRRVDCAEALLRERHQASVRGWTAAEWVSRQDRFARSSEDNGDKRTVEGLLLIGREWLRGLNHTQIATLELSAYGENTFDPLLFTEACESPRLWGYDCPFADAPKAADHLFPKSLGGPTDTANRLTLCQWHNTAKSMDVHIFPWEEGVPDWVPSLLRTLAAWIEPGAQRIREF
jgi:hypothetical protein